MTREPRPIRPSRSLALYATLDSADCVGFTRTKASDLEAICLEDQRRLAFVLQKWGGYRHLTYRAANGRWLPAPSVMRSTPTTASLCEDTQEWRSFGRIVRS